MYGNRKREIRDPPGVSITEQDYNFMRSTRLFTKKRKDWQGKRKPIERKELEAKEKEEVDIEIAFKRAKIKHTCIYCGKDYKGTYKDNHEDECIPKEQILKPFCEKCNTHNVPYSHICGVKDFYYDLKTIKVKDEDNNEKEIDKFIIDHENSYYQ